MKSTFLFGLLATAIACSACWAGAEEETSAVVAMHPALRVFGEDDEWEEVARLRLGCATCERVSNVNFRDPTAVYLFNRDGPMVLGRSDIDSALIGSTRHEGATVYSLVLILTPSGRARMHGYLEVWKDVSTINVVAGNLVGVTPLLLTHDWYGMAHFARRADAETVARRLEVPYRVQP